MAIRVAQRSTSLAHVRLMCPNRRNIARIQIGCGGDESAAHLMRLQALDALYIGSHHLISPVSVLVSSWLSCFPLACDVVCCCKMFFQAFV